MGKVWQLLLAVALATLVTGDVCPYEVCQCTSSTIDCRNKGLSTLPPLKTGIFTQTTLDISDNNITSIADGQLPPGLVHLTSHNTPLAAIDDNAFNGSSSTLQYLDLSYNKIRNIDVLINLDNIGHLDLSYNMINDSTRISTALYPHRESLMYLNLGSNNLTHIPDLGHMTKLQQLYLDMNQITSSATVSLPDSLTWLGLGSDYHTEIPHVVSGLSRLTTLDLDDDSIHSIDSFIFPSSLQTLYLQYNQIDNISSISFSQNTSDLTHLYLSENPITHIANDAFTQLSKLTTLYLYSTRLTRLPLALRSLTQMTYLNLDLIPTLTCTCQEAALVPWYNNLTSPISAASLCDGTDVDYFLSHLAQNCTSP